MYRNYLRVKLSLVPPLPVPIHPITRQKTCLVLTCSPSPALLTMPAAHLTGRRSVPACLPVCPGQCHMEYSIHPCLCACLLASLPKPVSQGVLLDMECLPVCASQCHMEYCYTWSACQSAQASVTCSACCYKHSIHVFVSGEFSFLYGVLHALYDVNVTCDGCVKRCWPSSMKSLHAFHNSHKCSCFYLCIISSTSH